MGYGGIDQVEIDDEFGYFYVHREGTGGGYWNRYSIEEEPSFFEFVKGHEGDIEVFHLKDGMQITESEFQDINSGYGQDDFNDWYW